MFRLERRAKVVRSRLLRAVDALDTRRHQVAEIGRRTKRIAKPALLSVLGLAAIASVSAIAFGLMMVQRRRRSIALRLSSRLASGTSRAMKRVEQLGRPSLMRRVFDKVMLTVATFAAGELAKRVTRNAIDGRFADGRLVVGKALERHHRDDGITISPRSLPADGITTTR